MRAVVKKDQTVRTIQIEVADGPELDVTRSWQKRSLRIKVDIMMLSMTDGGIEELKVGGRLIRKDGSLGETRSVFLWGTFPDPYLPPIKEAPAWAQQIWDEVAVGVTTWEITP